MARMRLVNWCIASVLVLAASCGGSESADRPCARVSALVNGSAVAPPELGVAPASVVAVVVRHQDHPDDATLCTGVRLDDRHVATAAHCFDDDPSAMVTILSDATVSSSLRCAPTASPAAGQVQAFRLHPQRDLAVIDTAPSLETQTRPCDVTTEVGSMVYAAGYGLDEDGKLGTRRYLATQVVTSSDDAIGTQATSAAGTCVGDSGGPLFVADGGQACVAGTLFTGSADCRGLGRYVPMTAVAGWIAGAR